MEQKQLIIVKPEKCVGCNACVRACPAPEANITQQLANGKFVTTVNPEKCIACGECVKHCEHGARDYVDDTNEAIDAVFRHSEKFIVIAAPAIKTVFPTKWKNILNWFKSHGCLVYDVSFGAEICTWAHLRAMESGQIKHVITQPCAAIVRYVELYQPKLLKNLSPVHSPMLCSVKYIRDYLGRKERIIALSPCIAKKNEFNETGMVDFNVTFKKLYDYLLKLGVTIPDDFAEDFKYDFDGQQGLFGSAFPRIGGLRDNIWLHNPDINITTSDGVHKVYPELDMYASLPESKKPEIFDVLSCEYGCNVGAGTGQSRTIFDIGATMHEIENEAKSRRKKTMGLFGRGGEDKLFKKFDETLDYRDFMRSYTVGLPSRIPSDDELNDIFAKMGKTTESDKCYDCHACGYKSCREMATAIYRGLNTPENCIVNAKRVIACRHKALSDLVVNVTKLLETLTVDVNVIGCGMTAITDANDRVVERTNVVKDLMTRLKNIVPIIVSEKDTNLLKDRLNQVVTLLDTIIDAFGCVNQYVENSNTEVSEVGNQVCDIKNLVSEINETLASMNI